MNDLDAEFTYAYTKDWHVIKLAARRANYSTRHASHLADIYYAKNGSDRESWIEKDAVTRTYMLAYKRV